jgi:hypothetical protein
VFSDIPRRRVLTLYVIKRGSAAPPWAFEAAFAATGAEIYEKAEPLESAGFSGLVADRMPQGKPLAG